MRLISLYIEEFGKLADLSLDLCEGLNLIEGKNESGKSTLLAFLRFALYGFPRRSTTAEGEERDKRLSWHGRRAAGSLTLLCQGEAYTITRSFWLRGTAGREQPSETLSVVRLSDRTELSLNGLTPGEYFLGLPAELYDSSLCLSQSDAARVESPGVRKAVGDLLFSDEMTLCGEDAKKTLDNARRELRHAKGRGGRLTELEDARAALSLSIAEATENAARLSALRAEAHRLRTESAAKRAALFEVTAAAERADIERRLSAMDSCDAAALQVARATTTLHDAEDVLALLPDEKTLSDLEKSLLTLDDTRRRAALLAPRIEEQAAVKHDGALLEGHRLIAEHGGAEALLAAHGRAKKKRSRHGIATLLFFLPALLLSLLALPLAAWRFALLGGAAATLSLSLWQLILFVKAGKRAAALTAGLGLSNAAMLRTYLTQCEREGEFYAATQARLAELQTEYDAARALEGDLLRDILRTLAPLTKEEKPETPQAAAAALLALTRKREAAKAAVLAAEAALEKTKGAYEALAARLEGDDRTALLARRATLPAPTKPAEALHADQLALQDALALLEGRLAEAERAESALSATARDPDALLRERTAIDASLKKEGDRLAAINLAMTAIDEATEELRRGITPRLREDASRIFRELTEGAYDELSIGNDFSITLMGGGTPLPLSRFSAGCRDAAHLSLRLALLATLSEEQLPLLLDEAFSRLDDDRARALLALLRRYAAGGGQVLLFTCHSRERAWLADDPAVQRITLS